MSVSPISTSLLLGTGETRVPTRTLDQQDFLKLLATQMSSQDPLNPQSDTQFIAQMAQFSALEQSKSMQGDMAKLRSDQELSQANALLGRTVTLKVTSDTDTNTETKSYVTVQGTVSAVQIEEGTPKLVVNGQKYELDQVVTISPESVGSSTSTLNTYARISQLGR
jgi:flagellar basal-body rod modification protein FlgD